MLLSTISRRGGHKTRDLLDAIQDKLILYKKFKNKFKAINLTIIADNKETIPLLLCAIVIVRADFISIPSPPHDTTSSLYILFIPSFSSSPKFQRQQTV